MTLSRDERFKEFVRWTLNEVWLGNIDSAEVQEKAAELGLIVETKYDPEIHGENDVDAEPGDPWYDFCDELKKARKP